MKHYMPGRLSWVSKCAWKAESLGTAQLNRGLSWLVDRISQAILLWLRMVGNVPIFPLTVQWLTYVQAFDLVREQPS
jgi:hypothetical protein